jgi:hypothetical protein
MGKHSSGTAFLSTMPSSLPGASLLEEGNERHYLNALWSGRRIERILVLRVGLVVRNDLFEPGGTVRHGRREDVVIDRLAFGGRRLFVGLGGSRRKVDSLQISIISLLFRGESFAHHQHTNRK